MHRAQAQLRAIENGRYIVRSANTGISAIISSKGEVIDHLGPNVGGIVRSDVHLNDHTTLYTVIGNLMVYLFLTFFALVLACEMFFRVRDRRNAKNK